MSSLERIRAAFVSLAGAPAGEGGARPDAAVGGDSPALPGASGEPDRYRAALELISRSACVNSFMSHCWDHFEKKYWCGPCIAADALADNRIEQR